MGETVILEAIDGESVMSADIISFWEVELDSAAGLEVLVIEEALVVLPFPVTPPLAPLLAIREAASSGVAEIGRV